MELVVWLVEVEMELFDWLVEVEMELVDWLVEVEMELVDWMVEVEWNWLTDWSSWNGIVWLIGRGRNEIG